MPSPIHALAGNVIHAFEQPKGALNQDVFLAVEQGIVAREIHLLDDDAPPEGPCAIKNEGKPAFIQINRAHLELLWAFTYGWMVLYEEAVQKPMIA